MAFIHKLRKDQKITMRQLCHGLCSQDRIVSMENGRREPDRFWEDFLLDRLGIGAEDYEHKLYPDEFRRQAARQRILHAIAFERIKRAGKALAEYRRHCPAGDKLEQQFCLSMRAQIRRLRGGSREELSALFEEAVSLTIPASGKTSLADLILSTKEMNLLLETEHYRRGGERPERYLEILDYIESRPFDHWSLAKIYPKAVYFLCRCAMEADEADWDIKGLLGYCRRALEILSQSQRMYYLWEILCLQERLSSSLAERLAGEGQKDKADGILKLFHENVLWRQTLEEIYTENNVPRETFHYCYLYVMQDASCVSTIIRCRREMLGMRQRELCSGICDEKTLQRLEHGKTKIQRPILNLLLNRLGLSVESIQTELVTSSRAARELMTRLRLTANEKNYDKTQQLLEEIRALVPADIRCNQQTLLRTGLRTRWQKKELSSGDYLRQMRKVLELTMPFDAFLKEGRKYLTRQEQLCIQNMMLAMDQDGEEYLTCLHRLEELYRPLLCSDFQETKAILYEFVMNYVGSVYGNRGDFDRSDQYNEFILKGALRFRRLGALPGAIYGIWWNHSQRKQKGIPVKTALDDEKELNKCIQLSRLANQKYDENFYIKKWEQLKKQ